MKSFPKKSRLSSSLEHSQCLFFKTFYFYDQVETEEEETEFGPDKAEMEMLL